MDNADMFNWDCSNPQSITLESLQEIFGCTKYHGLIFPEQLPVGMTTCNLAQTKVCIFPLAYLNF